MWSILLDNGEDVSGLLCCQWHFQYDVPMPICNFRNDCWFHHTLWLCIQIQRNYFQTWKGLFFLSTTDCLESTSAIRRNRSLNESQWKSELSEKYWFNSKITKQLINSNFLSLLHPYQNLLSPNLSNAFLFVIVTFMNCFSIIDFYLNDSSISSAPCSHCSTDGF